MAKEFMAGDFGIEAELDRQDGLYCVIARDVDADLDPGDGLESRLRGDIALVTTLGQWGRVEINISRSPNKMDLPSAAWDSIAGATIEVTQPLHIVDMEFDPAAAAAIP